MSSLLSAISGQLAKAITLGTLFPVLIISILNVIFVVPIAPWASGLQLELKKIAIGEDKWPAAALIFVVLVLTGVLYNLNIPVIRLYEGYPWKDSWIGWAFTWRKKRQFRKAQPLRLSVRYLLRELRKCNPTNPNIASLAIQQRALGLILNTQLPDQESLVMPTTLGNVIRCFERYPTLAYGMDAIALWPRLIPKIDPALGSAIDDAKTSLDFTLNCSFLSAITAVGVVAIGLSSSTPLTRQAVLPWAWRALVFLVLAVIFYRFSIGRAIGWGSEVRSAFDLHRMSLLSSLGFQQQPLSYEEEQSLWRKISSQLVFPDSRDSPLDYKDKPSRAVVTPVDLRLGLDRQVVGIAANGNTMMEIVVKNLDPRQRSATAVSLIESIPDGYKYAPDSASSSQGPVKVRSLKPLEFVLDPIAPGATVSVGYALKATSP